MPIPRSRIIRKTLCQIALIMRTLYTRLAAVVTLDEIHLGSRLFAFIGNDFVCEALLNSL